MKKTLFLALVISLLALSVSRWVNRSEELRNRLIELGGEKGLNFFEIPGFYDLENIPSDPKNPLNNAKVALGRQLFYEPLLGANPELPGLQQYQYSCATCHAPKAAFQFGGRQAIGDGGDGFGIMGERRTKHPGYREREVDVQARKTPSVLNTPFQSLMFWDGQFGGGQLNWGTEIEWKEGTPMSVNHLGYEGLESQAIAAFKVHRLGLTDTLFKTNGEYKALFDQAFSDVPKTSRYTDTTAALAIAAYERTLLTNNAPFQQWLKGNEKAMSLLEIEGAALFFGKAGCFNCHTGPALNSEGFHALGMGELKGKNTYQTRGIKNERLGRGGFTKRDADKYKFKVPQLYNLADASFYGHGATFTSVKEVVEYLNNAKPQNNEIHAEQLSPYFKPLNLSENEVEVLTAFLLNALRDTTIYTRVPQKLMSGAKVLGVEK